MRSPISPKDFSPPPIWSWRLAATLGLIALCSGLGFLVLPSLSASLWGFPQPSTSSHRAYLRLVGVRDVYVALGLLLFWLRGEKRVVGRLLMLAGMVPVADGLVALWNAAPLLQVVQHFAGTAVCAVVGYSLIA